MIALEPGADGQRLVLVRHGQTPSNVAGVLDTALPGPGLTEEGQQQGGGQDEAQRGGHDRSLPVGRAGGLPRFLENDYHLLCWCHNR